MNSSTKLIGNSGSVRKLCFNHVFRLSKAILSTNGWSYAFYSIRGSYGFKIALDGNKPH